MPRRAAVQLLTCVLALVTAVALLAAAATIRRRRSRPLGRANETVVREFYGAIDQVLLAGDTAMLESVVDPGLVAMTCR